ncbi:MAG: universal stress protein [Ignavibacteriaceae bacterium]
MKPVFEKLGLAITFSPTGRALLKEVKRLKELFGASLVLIHVGKKNRETEELLASTVSQAGIDYNSIEVIWSDGDPGTAIIESSRDAGVDLLIAGALEKEKFIKYYLGSVARKIMREAYSSTLILTSPSENPESFKKFYVSADFSKASEKTIITSYNFALLEKASEFILIKDFHLPGLSSTVLSSGSAEETQHAREYWINQEEGTMKLFAKELNLSGIPVTVKALYGKEGWEAGNFARINNADLFAISAPARKLKFLDRLFTHEVEYLFEDLPANLLIIR